ncbi:hypothetical protein HPP92_018875 [Vanilla planifolia]|uniref:Angiotensin-converting enzyme 2 n=2 Tax=Vanilla planifolia TaxID=51239 RepID=A0A835UME3_VANPL|nr:hypothetical protein HPP92_018875 [Vanilla planifolia]
MAESSASYIRMVQHLIEKCLIHKMNKDECVEALNKHANIKPIVTSTVWAELEKENREFFDFYERERGERASEMEAVQRMKNIIAMCTAKGPDDDKGDRSV